MSGFWVLLGADRVVSASQLRTQLVALFDDVSIEGVSSIEVGSRGATGREIEVRVRVSDADGCNDYPLLLTPWDSAIECAESEYAKVALMALHRHGFADLAAPAGGWNLRATVNSAPLMDVADLIRLGLSGVGGTLAMTDRWEDQVSTCDSEWMGVTIADYGVLRGPTAWGD